MKKILLVSAVSLSLLGCATMDRKAAEIVEASSNPLKEYSEIVELKGVPKAKVFDASKQWMARSFKSANNVIQYADAGTGTIIGKGNIKYPCQGFGDCLQYEKGIVNFTLTIDTKDDKAKVSFSDIGISVPTTVTGGVRFEAKEGVPVWEEAPKKAVTEKLKAIIADYKSNVIKYQADNNW